MLTIVLGPLHSAASYERMQGNKIRVLVPALFAFVVDMEGDLRTLLYVHVSGFVTSSRAFACRAHLGLTLRFCRGVELVGLQETDMPPPLQ